MTTEVTVIGAGLIGLATAFELTEFAAQHEQDLRIRVIDPEPLSGASHHAAGMLAPAAEMQYQQEELLPLMRQSAAWYPSLVKRAAAAISPESVEAPTRLAEFTGFRQDGTYVVAGDSADRVHLNELLEFQRSLGMTAERITVRQVRGTEPSLSPGLAGAVHIPGDHQVDPRKFGGVLLRCLERRGVQVERRRAIPEDLPEQGNSERVAIVANGLGASAFFSYLSLRSVFGDIVRMRVPERLNPLVTSVVRGFVRDRPVYLVPRIDGRLVLGATSREDGKALPVAGGVLDLLRDAALICPGVQECEIEEVTAGARPGTPDDLPYIGIDAERGAVISTGYFRHGILLTALAARAGAVLALAQAGVDAEVRDAVWQRPGEDAPEFGIGEVCATADIYRNAEAE